MLLRDRHDRRLDAFSHYEKAETALSLQAGGGVGVGSVCFAIRRRSKR